MLLSKFVDSVQIGSDAAERDLDRVVELLAQASSIQETTHALKRNASRAYQQKAILQLQRQDFDGSLESLRRGEELMAELLHDQPNSSDSRGLMAAILSSRSTVLHRQGHADSSLEAARQALAHREGILAIGRQAPGEVVDWCDAVFLVAQSLVRLGRTEETISLVRESVAKLEGLGAEGKPTFELLGQLITMRRYLGKKLSSTAPGESRRQHSLAVEEARVLRSMAPDSIGGMEPLAVSLSALADLCRVEDPKRCNALWEESVEIHRTMVRRFDHAILRQNLRESLSRWASSTLDEEKRRRILAEFESLEAETGDSPVTRAESIRQTLEGPVMGLMLEAEWPRFLERLLPLWEEINAISSDHPDLRLVSEVKATCLDLLALAYSKTSQLDLARSYRLKAIDTWTQLAAGTSEWSTERSSLIGSQALLGMLERKCGRPAEALPHLETAVEYYGTWFDETESELAGMGLVHNGSILAETLVELGETDRARELAEHVLEQAESLSGGSLDMLEDRIITLEELAD